MKKKLIKKLSLNRATVTRLQNEEMKVIKGGTLLTFETCNCDTASCSIFLPCCGPKTKEKVIELEKNLG